MNKITYKANEIIHSAGSTADTLDYIISGRVIIKSGSFSFKAKPGAILGILEQASAPYSYDYYAEDDVVIASYPFTRFSDTNQIVEDHFEDCNTIITSTSGLVVSIATKYRLFQKNADSFYKDIHRHFNRYRELCGLHGLPVQSFPYLETLQEFVPNKDMPDWVSDYYDQLELMPADVMNAFYSTHSSLITSTLWEASSHARLFMSLASQASEYLDVQLDKLFSSSNGDLFDLYLNLLNRAPENNDLKYAVSGCINDIIDNMERMNRIDESILEQRKAMFTSILSAGDGTNDADTNEDMPSIEMPISKYELVENSLDTILRYSNMDEAEDERFRQMVSEFKSLKDKNLNDDNIVSLRHDITKSFLDIYEAAIISSFEAPKVPVILKMFFCFGYMDEELIGRDNAVILYDIAEKMNYDNSKKIYTIYDWLLSIYKGENEPSKNEFDQDYPTYLKSQKANGYISEEMEKRYLESPKEKLRFEIRNFFKSSIKVCSGRPSSFCPILSEHNIIKSLESTIVQAEKLEKNWSIIKAIDYSAFYRQCTFQAPEHRLIRESIIMEVMPIVVLMPTIGSRALLWQETSGVRRDTPGRIAMPMFIEDDLFLMQAKLTAEFRWEMCKRITGSRWNDVSEHCLTSDYFDYLQFYRKNHDLSPEAKEKVKAQISSGRNSFKNVFVSDYITWIRYEALGSPRLNKVAKAILFKHCPFSKPIREKLKSNPLYETMIARHENVAAKNYRMLSAKYAKIKGSNLDNPGLPPEIEDYINYYAK